MNTFQYVLPTEDTVPHEYEGSVGVPDCLCLYMCVHVVRNCTAHECNTCMGVLDVCKCFANLTKLHGVNVHRSMYNCAHVYISIHVCRLKALLSRLTVTP